MHLVVRDRQQLVTIYGHISNLLQLLDFVPFSVLNREKYEVVVKLLEEFQVWQATKLMKA
jgi:hypothetical protein